VINIKNEIICFAANKWVLEAMFNGLVGPQRFTNLMSLEDVKPIAFELGEVIRNSRHKGDWPLNFVSYAEVL